MLTLRLKEWDAEVIAQYLVGPRLAHMYPKPREAFKALLRALEEAKEE